MNGLIAFSINTFHVIVLLLAGMQYNYAENFLHVMNTFAVIMVIIYWLIIFKAVNDPDKEVMKSMVETTKGNWFILRQWLYYLPMIALSAWFSFPVTTFITIVFGLSFGLSILVVREVYRKLIENS